MDDLHLFPYKMQFTQRILPTDRLRRLEYGQTVDRMIENEPEFWNQILMTVKAHFILTVLISKTAVFGERRIHTRSVKRHCMTKKSLSRPAVAPKQSFFFRENEIDIGRRWLIMLARKCVKKVWMVTGFNMSVRQATLLIKQFSLCNENSVDVWYQNEVTVTRFDRSGLSFYGVIWKACVRKPQTINELKANIRDEIDSILPEVLKKWWEPR